MVTMLRSAFSAWLAVFILIHLQTSRADAADGVEKTPTHPPAPVDAKPPSPETLRELGAAAWIPEDASLFSSTLRLDEQLRALTESVAYRRLSILPGVQLLRAQVLQNPIWKSFLAERKKNPLLQKGLAVLSDLVSHEVFVYTDARLADFLRALSNVYIKLLCLKAGKALSAGPSAEAEPAEMIAIILAEEKALQIPPFVLGFRLTRAEAARELLDEIEKEHGKRIPFPMEREEIGGGRYWHARLDLEKISPDILKDLSSELQRAGVPEDDVKKMRRFIASRTLVVSVGIRGDYLLFSIASDTAHLAKLGKGRSLAESPAFAPVFRHWKPRLCSLSYVAANLTGGGKLDAGHTLGLLDQLLASVPEGKLPDGLAPRLKKDAADFVEEINRGQPDAMPELSASYIDRGLETFSFCAAEPAISDSARPLKALERKGTSPLFLVAWRNPSLLHGYARAAHWAQAAWSYFTEYAEPRMSEEDRKELERIRRYFVPAIEELHATTRDAFLPSIDNCECLLVADSAVLPVPGVPEPIALPRPALVIEVRDREKLTTAFTKYRETLNHFFVSAAKEYRSSPIEIPAPTARPHAAGTLYAFPGAGTLGPGFEPHTLVTDKYAVLGLWPSQTDGLLSESRPIESPVVDLAAPAVSVSRIELERFSMLILDDAGVVMRALRKDGSLPDGVAQLAGLHLVELRAILGTFKSYTSHEYVEGNLQVLHSWLHVEDISE